MNHHKYLAIIGASALFAWIGWILVITQISPYANLSIALVLFFITLFIALTGTFGVLGFYFRVWLFKNEIFYRHINVSMRQGTFLSLIAVFCLIFQMLRVLTWWSGLLVIGIAVLLEFYFSSKDSEVA